MKDKFAKKNNKKQTFCAASKSRKCCQFLLKFDKSVSCKMMGMHIEIHFIR